MDKYYNDILIDKIVSIMERKGITKLALAARVDMKPQTLGNYLLKNRAIPYEVAIKLIKELKIDINFLYNFSENKDDEYEDFLKFKKLFEEIINKENNHLI
ncbi:MAG: helix-turn-helix transcriptional regulator [Erysipelotrichaceae bacterium]|nr:helix-turn-helix transcriptional regulator [Erysipelotrichaceae bacterium]